MEGIKLLSFRLTPGLLGSGPKSPDVAHLLLPYGAGGPASSISRETERFPRAAVKHQGCSEK